MPLKFLDSSIFFLLLFNLSLCQKCKKTFTIYEEIAIKTLIGNLSSDNSHGSTFQFAMDGGENTKLFQIDLTSGHLMTRQRIDRETVCDHEIVECKLEMKFLIKPGKPIVICQLEIIILDINDNSPFFDHNLVTRDVDESFRVNSIIPIKGAEDYDSGNNSVRFYELFEEVKEFDLKFEQNGFLFGLVLKNPLDRETKDFYNLTLVAKDNGIPQKSGSVIIHIRVKDVNDNKPQFTQASYNVDVFENSSISSVILTLSAKDADLGRNSEIGYKFYYNVKQKTKNIFSIDKTTGEITLINKLDYEKKTKYTFSVVAFDHGYQALSSIVSVTINVLNVNDNKPIISILHLNQNVSELEKIGEAIAQISVSDKDDDDGDDAQKKISVNCSINNPYFNLNSEINQVIIAKQLDYENCSVHNVTILCHDFGDPQLESQKSLLVFIRDENDNTPVFKNPILINQAENKEFKPFQVAAKDLDSGINSNLSYKLYNDSVSQLFTIINQNGFITTNLIFDRENCSEYELKVLAMDKGSPSLTGTGTVLLRILDENDERPAFKKDHFVFHVQENQASSTQVGNIQAKDLDIDDNGRLAYFIEDDNESSENFYIDNGNLKTKKTLTYTKNLKYEFKVFATDHGIPPLSSSTNITVYVDDINNNSPYFLFPTVNNNSISIIYEMTSTIKPITKIIASDNDEGENAKLSYYLVSPPEAKGLFRINHTSGEIMLIKGSEVEVEEEPIELKIIIKDQGKPQRDNSSLLYITVGYWNNSKPFRNSDDDYEDIMNRKIGIILGIAMTCLFLCMIVVICIVRRLDDNRRRYPPKKFEDVAMMRSLNQSVSTPISLNILNNSEKTDNTSLKPQIRFGIENSEFLEEEEGIEVERIEEEGVEEGGEGREENERQKMDERLNEEEIEIKDHCFGQLSIQGSSADLL